MQSIGLYAQGFHLACVLLSLQCKGLEDPLVPGGLCLLWGSPCFAVGKGKIGANGQNLYRIA